MEFRVSDLDKALRQFEAAESNLKKAEKVWKRLQAKIDKQGQPNYVTGDREYERDCRTYLHLISALPKIDEWKPEAVPPDLADLTQQSLDAREVGEVDAWLAVERWANLPGTELDEYRFQFDQKRRALVREAVDRTIGEIDGLLEKLGSQIDEENGDRREDISNLDGWTDLEERVNELDVLLGSSVSRPERWGDLQRHLHFGMLCDLLDIREMDWPSVKAGIRPVMYAEEEPLPVETEDLAALVSSRPKGRVATKLNWGHLDAEEFERLLYTLISSTEGYENPDWLMRTNAPDRGRDLAAERVQRDALSGTHRSKVIVQAKHWPTKSISVSDISTLKDQVEVWEPEILVLATSGRFTGDAVNWVEQHNKKGVRPKIEFWPESHLERLLAERPDLVAEFGLR